MHGNADRRIVISLLLLLPAGVSGPGAADGQVADTSAVAEAPDRASSSPYLFTAPSGRTLGAGELLVGVRSVRLGLGERQFLGPMALLDIGVTDRITLMSGYWLQSYGDDQDGEAVVGASADVGSVHAPLVVQAEVTLPIDHYLGRRLGYVTVTGVRQWGDASRALTAGAGWRGSRSLCRPEWAGCESSWHGDPFGLVGGYLGLSDHVQLVSENYLRLGGSLETLTGVRARVGGLTAGVGLGCAAYAGMGIGADCGDGLQLSASYQLGLIAGR